MPNPLVFRHQAMATWFEIRVTETEPDYAGQAAAEAFRHLDHLENLLSRFRESSDISAVNQLQPGETATLSAEAFACLRLALEMHQLTGGAFDPCLGAAMDRLREPSEPNEPPASLVSADLLRGRLLLDAPTLRVTCEGAPVNLDLGAIGKGFAVDQLGELLRDWEIGPALLVGGGSSILATKTPQTPWQIGLTRATNLQLSQGSISCSGLSVKGAHILDPRTGQPAVTPARVWVLSASAGVSDALSTAFMVMPSEDIATICDERPECGAIIQPTETSPETIRIGRALAVSYGFERLTPSGNP
jgi:FAD:protein FMN transferase